MKRFVVFLLALCLLCGSAPAALPEENAGGDVRLLCLNIGKADCMLLFYGEDCFLIDSGYVQTWPALKTALEQYGVTRLSGVFQTHCHKDHEGGLVSLARYGIPVDAWYASPITTEAIEKNKIVKAAALRGQEVTWLGAGMTVPAGDASFRVLGPLYLNRDNENCNSLVMVFSSPRGSILLCGDMKKEELQGLLEAGAIPPCDLLKVPHHGDSGSTPKELVSAARPKAAVILTNTHERPETPGSGALKRLKNAGCDVYVSQDFHDAVLFTLSGGEVRAEDVVWDGVPLRAEGLVMSLDLADDMITISNASGASVSLSGYEIFSTKGDDWLILPDLTLEPGGSVAVGTLSSRGAADITWQEKRVWSQTDRDTAILYDLFGRPVAWTDNGIGD